MIAVANSVPSSPSAASAQAALGAKHSDTAQPAASPLSFLDAMLAAAGVGKNGGSATSSADAIADVNIQIAERPADVSRPDAAAFSFIDAMPVAAGAGEEGPAVSSAHGASDANTATEAEDTDVPLPCAASSSFIAPMLQIVGADKVAESGPAHPAALATNAIAPEHGKLEAKSERPQGKKDAKESDDQPLHTLPSILLQQAVVNAIKAASDPPLMRAPIATVSAAEGCTQAAIKSIPAPVITAASGAGKVGEFRAIVPSHERLVPVVSSAATQPGALDALPASVSPVSSDGLATGAPNEGESSDESPLVEPSKSGSEARAANGEIVNRSHTAIAAPGATPKSQPADAAHAAQQMVCADAANDAQQTDQTKATAQVSANYAALLQGILTPSTSNAEAASPQAPSTDGQDGLSARRVGGPASETLSGNVRNVSTKAVATFSGIAASAGAIDQNVLPIAKEGEVNTDAPLNRADGSTLAKDDKESAGAATDAKQHTAVMPAHDARSDGAGATQLVNVAQGPAMDAAQRASAAAASAAGQAVIAHAQSAAYAPASGHAVSRFEVPVRAQESATGSAEIQAHAPVAVNSARLIQRLGESEIRVGMRSSDFGDVSISTAVGRNSISAQISLDHGELAKAIAAHLPEVQARLDTSQPVDVRISTTQQPSGQIGYAPGGMGQSAGQGNEYGGRQQSNGQRAGVVERSIETVSLPAAVMESSLDPGRLDIRA